MPTPAMTRQLLVNVTEHAALAAAATMGYGDPEHSAAVAADAMRGALDDIGLAGRVVIGPVDDGSSPRLARGVKVGEAGAADPQVDLAVDPLEGSDLCASGVQGSVSVLAAAEPGSLLRVPEIPMEKIVVGPSASGAIHLDAPVPENLRNIARTFGREVSDLTVVVLKREGNKELIADLRSAGARIRQIVDGDLSASISAAVRGTGVHAVMGTGGASAAILAAAAMRCLGGEIQARLAPRNKTQEKQVRKAGFEDARKIFSMEELAPGDRLVLSCTGVTDGELLRGVRFFGGGSRTSTLFMSLHEKVVRFVDTIHREDLTNPVIFH